MSQEVAKKYERRHPNWITNENENTNTNTSTNTNKKLKSSQSSKTENAKKNSDNAEK